MILQSLTEYFEQQAQKGNMPPLGWSHTEIHYEICLRPDGSVEQIVDLRIPRAKGKPAPQTAQLPAWGCSPGNAVRSNVYWNNATYIFGMAEPGSKSDDAVRLTAKVEDCNRCFHEVLDQVKGVEAEAVLKFLDGIKADGVPDYVKEMLSKDMLMYGNFVFSVNGVRLDSVPETKEAWDAMFWKQLESGPRGTCLVTGEQDTPLAQIHPFIKGLSGAQGAGAGLSTFNMPSATSFGYEQNLNAPVGMYAAHAYTQAMQHLLHSPDNSRVVTKEFTLLWWSVDAEDDANKITKDYLFGPQNAGDMDDLDDADDEDEANDTLCAEAAGDGGDEEDSSDGAKWGDKDLADIVIRLSQGKPVGNMDPERDFCVMGVSPNTSRIIVWFFYRGSFGPFINNVRSHYERLALEGQSKPLVPGWAFRVMLPENYNFNKNSLKMLVNAYFRSVLFGDPYPEAMLDNVLQRLKSNEKLNESRLRAQISLIKAYGLRNLADSDKRKECFAMNLQEENREPAYLLGRLFMLYEEAQNIGLGTGRKPWDAAPLHSMFGTAMTNPASVFPTLARKAEIHLVKPECFWVRKQVTEVKDMLTGYPKSLNSTEQGMFDLGYYHQRMKAVSKKKKEESVCAGAESEENNGDQEQV